MLKLYRSILRRVLIYPLILLLIYWSLGCALQRKMLYPREYTQPSPQAKDGVPGLEVITLQTPEGPVEAWFIPGDAQPRTLPCARGPRRPTVIFAHGNAELIDNNAKEFARYREMGINVLVVEFRGYGRSAGSPSQAAIVADFAAARKLIEARPDVDPQRFIYHGRSIGGGVVCALAEEHEPAAMILESPFLSVKRMANRRGFPSFLVLDPFDNEAVVPKLACPVLIMHGRRDSIIPFSDGQRLSQLAKRGTFVAYDCDHNDLPPDRIDYWRRIVSVLQESRAFSPLPE